MRRRALLAVPVADRVVDLLATAGFTRTWHWPLPEGTCSFAVEELADWGGIVGPALNEWL